MSSDRYRRRWSVLSRILFREDPFRIFNIMKHSYDGRAYHNLDHVAHMQTMYSQYLVSSGSGHIPDALIDVAIWFHDIVYIPGNSDNEEKSFDFFNKLLGHNLTTNAREDVRRMIMATKHNFDPRDEMEALIIDLDMSILGSSPEEFSLYEEKVKQEHLGLYTEEAYNNGRKAFMQNLLNQDGIFFTDHFHDRFEKQARINLAKYES